MTQDLARIRAFVQVYDAGGFSAAARIHGRSKALLSKYVTDLEDYLGVRLMNRTTRKLSLTEAGEAYYRDVSEILSQLDDLDASITDQTAAPRGILRVSAPRNFGETTLLDPLFEFVAIHPELTLDLRLEDRMVDLVDEGIDLALRISKMQDTSLIARKIAKPGLPYAPARGLSRPTAPRKPPIPCAVCPASSTPTWPVRPIGGSPTMERPFQSMWMARCASIRPWGRWLRRKKALALPYCPVFLPNAP
jgi:DNA-binding transcriptional LysR family regulator